MRVYVGGLMHEANAFSPVATPPDAFARAPHHDPALQPDDWFGYGDLIKAVRAAGDIAIPGVFFSATPSAPCSAETFDDHCAELIGDLAAATPYDAVLLFLHGAQTAQGEDDCAGKVAALVREVIGPSVPLGVLMDLHANVTQRLLDAADLVAACKEYPHTDFAEVGAQIWDSIKSDRPLPGRAWQPVAAFPASTTTRGPMQQFVATLRTAEADAGIICISAIHGFPHADVPHASSGILVYAESQEIADCAAQRLGSAFLDAILEAADDAPGLTLDGALEIARHPGRTPLLIAERSDNPGAGGGGDATHLLHALRDAEIGRCAVALLHDPEAVEAAVAAGEGQRIELAIGGKANELSGPPFVMQAQVRAIRTDAMQPVFEGATRQSLGTSVLLEERGLNVIVNTIRQQPFSPQVFTEHRIDPREMDVIVVKSTNHFYNGFAPLVGRIIYCDAPGSATEDLAALPYRRLTRPVWPLDPIDQCRAAQKLMSPNTENGHVSSGSSRPLA